MVDLRAVAGGALDRLPFEKEMLLLPRFVRRGDVCIDVGASYGAYTVALARQVGERGRVHAIEPRPGSLAVLRMLVGALTRGNVVIHPLAVADAPRRDVLVTPRRRFRVPVPGRSFLKGAVDGDGTVTSSVEYGGGLIEAEVVTDTLDRCVEAAAIDRLAFVKIDVEGAELDVLDGAERTLLRLRPVVLCEIEERHTRRYGHGPDAVLERFADLGYRAHVWRPGRLQRVTRVLDRENNYLLLPGRPLSG